MLSRDGLARSAAASPGDPVGDGAHRLPGWKAAARLAAFLVAASIALSWVAIHNGAPLVFADSLMYATAAIERELPSYFSIFYSLIILPLHQGVTLWPVVLAQGAMMAHLVYLVARCVSDRRIGSTGGLVIVATLAVLSGLPWITGQIMPDVFTPVVILGMFLLGFCRHRLGGWELAYVGALTTAAIAAHPSHVPLALGLVVIGLVLRPFLAPAHAGTMRWLGVVIAPLLLATGMVLGVNAIVSREVGLARNSDVVLLAKLIEDGPALAYLRDACPARGYALCGHLDELKGASAEGLKWSGDSPFDKVGGPDALQGEARRIVWGTIAAYPLDILGRALRDLGRQLTRFQAGDGLSMHFAGLVAGHVGQFFGPEVEGALRASKQARGELPIGTARRLHLLGLLLATGFLAWSAIARRGALPREVTALYAFVLGSILCAAAASGALVGPYDRYLARVIWLICLAALIGAWSLFSARAPRVGRSAEDLH